MTSSLESESAGLDFGLESCKMDTSVSRRSVLAEIHGTRCDGTTFRLFNAYDVEKK